MSSLFDAAIGERNSGFLHRFGKTLTYKDPDDTSTSVTGVFTGLEQSEDYDDNGLVIFKEAEVELLASDLAGYTKRGVFTRSGVDYAIKSVDYVDDNFIRFNVKLATVSAKSPRRTRRGIRD